jgi:hypothetical protein
MPRALISAMHCGTVCAGVDEKADSVLRHPLQRGIDGVGGRRGVHRAGLAAEQLRERPVSEQLLGGAHACRHDDPCGTFEPVNILDGARGSRNGRH